MQGQPTDSLGTHRLRPILDGIAIEGNVTTRPEVILRELSLHRGDEITEEEVRYSKDRIYSLGLFNRVDLDYPPMDSTVLIISVHERLFFYPVPILEIIDRDLRHLRLGMGIVHNNLSGWNQRLWIATAFGYNPMVQAKYATPWFLGSGDYSMDVEFKFERTENRSPRSLQEGGNFSENRTLVVQNYGRRWNPYLTSWVSLGGQYLDATASPPGHTIASDRIDRSLVAGLGVKYDTRDLREYPSRGTFLSVLGARRWYLGLDNATTTMTADLSQAVPVIAGTFVGLRTFTRLQGGGRIPRYENSFFGYTERIRGWWDHVQEGENALGGSVEYNVPLVSPRYLVIPGMPIPEFALWRIAVYLAVFADAGTTWNRGERLDLAGMPYGYGAGLHILLPYSFVVRGDVAWNRTGRSEYILDISIRM